MDKYFRAFAEYNRDQYIPTKVHGAEEEWLITDANDLGDSRFYDPRTRQSFKYVHFISKRISRILF